MAMNFPIGPTEGQIFSPAGGYSYIYLGGVWKINANLTTLKTANETNLFINPGFQVSQENGSVAGSTNGYFAADQWSVAVSGLTGTATLVRHQYIGDGYPNRMRAACTVAQASMAAGYFMIRQGIEGLRISDSSWGTAGGRPMLLRIIVYTNVAGTYGFVLRNSPATHCYTNGFTIEANETSRWIEKVVRIEAPPAGTVWTFDNTLGIDFYVCLAAAPAYITAGPGWYAGTSLFTIPGQINFLSSTSNSFYIGGIGLHIDPQSTGVPPPWELPEYIEDFNNCLRYYEVIAGNNANIWSAPCTTAVTYYMTTQWKATKRFLPAVSGVIGSQVGFAAAMGTFLGNVECVREARASNLTSTGGYFYCASLIGSARM